jgi:hypothetical protein
VKRLAKKGKIRPDALEKGRDLYVAARLHQDALVTYLKTGLVVRFKPTDVARVKQLAEASDRAQTTFLAWAQKQLHPGVGDVSLSFGLEKLLEMLSSSDRNDKAIEMLRKDLDDCSLREWGALSSSD